MSWAVHSQNKERARDISTVGRPGFTLIELTVVLAVLVTLALVLTPSITNFINDSRVARTRSDTQTLATAVIQFYKDNGSSRSGHGERGWSGHGREQG